MIDANDEFTTVPADLQTPPAADLPEDDAETLALGLDCANGLIVQLEDLLRQCLPTAPEDVRARAEELLNR